MILPFIRERVCDKICHKPFSSFHRKDKECKKKISIITIFFICVLTSWVIQHQAALYEVPVIEIEKVRIKEDHQLITGRLMNTDQKGESIYLSVPYQKNQIETANIKARQMYLVQMHGDEWQLVAKKK